MALHSTPYKTYCGTAESTPKTLRIWETTKYILNELN